MRKYINYFSSTCAKIPTTTTKKVVCSCSTWHNQQLYKVATHLDKNKILLVKTIWLCCDLAIQSRSMRVLRMGKAQWVLQSYKVSTLLDMKVKFLVQTVWHCCDLEIQSRSSKRYEWVKLNEQYHHARFDIYHIYSVTENHNVKSFCHIQTIGWPAGQPA